VMVIDAAKGLEPQTLKLFRVCRTRGTPIITFVNKVDRPGREPLDLLDEIEREIGMQPTPITWPVLDHGLFLGVVDRRDMGFIPYRPPSEGGGGEAAPVPFDQADISGPVRARVLEDLALLEGVGADHDADMFAAGMTTPVFFGSALGDCGIRQLLEAVEDIGRAPEAWPTDEGGVREIDRAFSALVFKVQANTDPKHRDRIAFMRICSGRFERGLTVHHEPTGKTLGLRHAHQPFGQERIPVDEAYPGDVVGLVNAAGLRPGDTVYADEPVRFPPLPRFAPEHFAVVHNRDTSRYKQFRRGLDELDQEGVVQVLRRRAQGDQAPILAAVGPMQIEVATARMEGEFGAPIQVAPARRLVARETDQAGAERLARLGVEILERRSGELVALFRSDHHVDSIQRDNPELHLVRLLAG
jgi:peptide chain release factor 3